MSLREGPFGDIKPPIRWMAGLALVIAAIVAAGVFLSDHRQGARPGLYGAVRRSADSVASPVGEVIATPFRWLDHGVGWIGDYVAAGSENHDLKAEVLRERRWRDIAMAMRLENARLRALAGVRTDPPIPMVLGRTVLEARGPFSNARLVDVGAARGVTEGNPALSDHGVVGRVVGVAPAASRVLLLTDAESRVPVLLPRTNGRAILTGDGGPNPALAFLRAHDALREGDRVLTSGDGGVFPRGLPVGSVVRGFGGEWRIALDSDESPVDFVQILLFTDFSQVAPASLAPTTLPTTATAPPPAPPAAPNSREPAVPPGRRQGRFPTPDPTVSALTVRPLNPLQWLGLPALACAAGSVLFAAPARLFGLQLPEPVFPIAAAFAWAVIRPSLLPPFVLLVLGFFLDLLWGGPLGLWPVCLLAGYAPIVLLQRSVAQLEFVGLAVSYALACALSLGAGWALASLRAGIAVNLVGVGWDYLATLLLFPIAFATIQRYQGTDARFR